MQATEPTMKTNSNQAPPARKRIGLVERELNRRKSASLVARISRAMVVHGGPTSPQAY
jgi:hypothetical protein